MPIGLYFNFGVNRPLGTEPENFHCSTPEGQDPAGGHPIDQCLEWVISSSGTNHTQRCTLGYVYNDDVTSVVTDVS